jgi:HEAT repeat protein
MGKRRTRYRDRDLTTVQLAELAEAMYDSRIGEQAAIVLLRRGQAGRNVLRQALISPDWWVSLVSARAMAQAGEPEAFGVLKGAIDGADLDQYPLAVDGLLHLGPRGERVLIQALEDEQSPRFLRELAVRALSEARSPASQAAIERATRSGDRFVRRAARDAQRAALVDFENSREP